jgi:hypothetical protein
VARKRRKGDAMAQVETERTTTARIMSSAAFERGLNEVRQGQPFDWRVNDTLWGYERGRLFGHIAPLDMPLRIGGKLNPKAVALCDAAINRKLVI